MLKNLGEMLRLVETKSKIVVIRRDSKFSYSLPESIEKLTVISIVINKCPNCGKEFPKPDKKL